MKKFKNSTLVLLLLLAAVLMAGCVKETEQENTDNTENTETVGHQNPNPAQNTPLAENYLSEFSSVYQLYPNTDGSFFALAGGDYTDYLLKLDNSGYVQQRVELGFPSRRCIAKTGENIVLIGNLEKSTSPYSMYEQGIVSVYDQHMQLVATTFLRDSQYKIELNTILQDSEDPTLFYVGGLAIDDSYIQYPYICTLRFSDGLMTKESSKVCTSYQKYRVIGMVEKQSSGQKDLILETIRYTQLDHPYNSNSYAVHVVKSNYFEETSGWGQETWDVAITGLHGDSDTGNNSIDSDENNIYFFGSYCDDKEPAPVSGYWDSGCVVAINWHQGQTVWTKTVSFTNKDEHFCDGFLSGGFLYACGNHSALKYTTTKKSFSNGLVAKMSLSGEVVAYKTFGNPERSSHLYHVVKDVNGNLVCVGRSSENLDDEKFKNSGWFLKTDMSTNRSFDDDDHAQQQVSDVELLDKAMVAPTTSMDDVTGFGEH